MTNGILFQDRTGDSVPPEYLPWIVKIETTFESTPGIKLSHAHIEDEKVENEENDEEGKEKINVELVIICMSITTVVLVVGGVLCVHMKMRRQTTQEEPKMEKNVYYGRDDEYYDEHNNRLEDTNDYYST